MRSYSDALESIPLALADNAGLNPIYYLSQVKSRQIAEKNPRLGIDCMQKGNSGELQYDSCGCEEDDEWVGDKWVDDEWVGDKWVDEGNKWVDDEWVGDKWVDDEWVGDKWVDDEWVGDKWVDDEWVVTSGGCEWVGEKWGV